MDQPSLKRTILILAASPADLGRLNSGVEIREIEEAIKLSPKRELFELKQLPAVRIDDLRRALLDFSPEIVHFSGHSFGTAGLAFESEEGQTQLFSTQALSKLFKLVSENVKCVLLTACFSEEQARSIVQHIDYVIGMRLKIGEGALIKFSVGFYDAISREKPVDIAYEFGCNAIIEYNIPEEDIPVLLKKSEAIELGQKNKTWNELEDDKHQSEQNKVSRENIVELKRKGVLLQIPSSTSRKLAHISHQVQELLEQVSAIKEVLDLQSNSSQFLFKNINPITVSTANIHKIVITIEPSSQISIVEINRISKFSRELDENFSKYSKAFQQLTKPWLGHSRIQENITIVRQTIKQLDGKGTNLKQLVDEIIGRYPDKTDKQSLPKEKDNIVHMNQQIRTDQSSDNE